MGKKIIIAGVGGQGVLLLTDIIAQAAISAGYDVKQHEIHGMSQRGGSVVCDLEFSHDEIRSPIIGKGEADLIIASEPLEALRMIDHLKKTGAIVYNSKRIDPMPVSIGKAKYPKEIEEKFQKNKIKYSVFDATSLAIRAGNIKALNVVMLGAATLYLPFDSVVWTEAIKEVIPGKLLALNMKAFEYGKGAFGKS